MSWVFSMFSKSRYDFVLHIEQVSDGLIEALSPQVIGSFSVYKLHVHAKPIATTLYGPFEHVADVQFQPTCLKSIDLPL